MRPSTFLLSAVALTVSLAAQAPTLRVALCGAASTTNTACQWTSPQNALLASGQFAVVDIINVTGTFGTPTLAQLQQYDALLCYTNSTPADNVAWGNVLADYVDAGGGVVVAVFANSTVTAGRNIDGRWQTGYEVISDRSGNASGANGMLGTVLVPAHPVMAGVTTFTGGSIGSRPSGTAIEPGSRIIAEWSDGRILVAEGANPRRIDLGFYPPDSTCSGSGWAVGGDQLMVNALKHVAGGASFQTYGTGCAGSLGVPSLAAAPGSLPTLGNVFILDIGNLPQNLGLIGMGFSNTQSGPFQLPLDLTSFGLNGCALLADPAVTQLLIGISNVAQAGFLVPQSTSFLNLQVYTQAFSLDAAANLAGLTVSAGGVIRVGT